MCGIVFQQISETNTTYSLSFEDEVDQNKKLAPIPVANGVVPLTNGLIKWVAGVIIPINGVMSYVILLITGFWAPKNANLFGTTELVNPSQWVAACPPP